MMKQHRVRIVVYSLLVVAALVGYRFRGHILALYKGQTQRDVDEVIAKHGARVEQKFRAHLDGAWPPTKVVLVGLKQERQLEVWAAPSTSAALVKIATYPVLAASGKLGPKLREGDQQVPEGVYALTNLNPNSTFHLSVRVDYPNDDDKQHATVPLGQIGSDIYVHGSNVSVGCLAIGNDAIEEVFTIVARAPAGQRSIVIAPLDLRRSDVDRSSLPTPHIPDLYAKIERALPTAGGR